MAVSLCVKEDLDAHVKVDMGVVVKVVEEDADAKAEVECTG